MFTVDSTRGLYYDVWYPGGRSGGEVKDQTSTEGRVLMSRSHRMHENPISRKEKSAGDKIVKPTKRSSQALRDAIALGVATALAERALENRDGEIHETVTKTEDPMGLDRDFGDEFDRDR